VEIQASGSTAHGGVVELPSLTFSATTVVIYRFMTGTEPAESKRHICIFCARRSDEVGFSREHVVPATIGGNLCLRDAVCVACNSFLGSEVDVTLLSDPEVITAMGALNWNEKRLAALRHHWLATTDSPQGLLRLRLGTDHQFEIAVQTLARDGSHVRADSLMDRWFDDQARAAVRRSGGTLSDEEVKTEIARLKRALSSIPPDSFIASEVFGCTIVKRSFRLTPRLEPRCHDTIERAVAKIALEFAYFVVGGQIAAQCTRNFLPLADLVRYDKEATNVVVARVESEANDFEPIHFLTLEPHEAFTYILVGFFRKITYAVIAPALPQGSLRALEENSGLFDISAVQCHMDVEKRTVRFGVTLADGTVCFLGET
jgi:hypothetical protein